jgi:hypothetical protein
MIKELLAAFYFQADSAFVGYGLAPLPLEAGEMLPAPSRAALDDGAGIGADLSHGGAGGFGRGIYAGTEQPGLPDKLMRDVRGEAGRRSRQSVGYHGSESLVSLVTTAVSMRIRPTLSTRSRPLAQKQITAISLA